MHATCSLFTKYIWLISTWVNLFNAFKPTVGLYYCDAYLGRWVHVTFVADCALTREPSWVIKSTNGFKAGAVITDGVVVQMTIVLSRIYKQ